VTGLVDVRELEAKVKDMYRAVAADPHGRFHFELGRHLALRLGYDAARLDAVPGPAVDSFAGVGFFFDLLDLGPGEAVLDLGSGSGMDVFYAAGLVGPGGVVLGVDFTREQLDKAAGSMREHRIVNVDLREGRIEALPVEDASVDAVISNGVINLCPDKKSVFAEAARVLRPGGRLAVADIVTEVQLVDSIVCNADLWASCIGGAALESAYLDAVTSAGLEVVMTRQNPYQFLSGQAQGASRRYGVKSISLLARKP
jgi:ubiquinone/menaquinone biosynthesis C-methylase UbiE